MYAGRAPCQLMSMTILSTLPSSPALQLAARALLSWQHILHSHCTEIDAFPDRESGAKQAHLGEALSKEGTLSSAAISQSAPHSRNMATQPVGSKTLR